MGSNNPNDRCFTLPELAQMSGIDYRTLHNWQKRGMLKPSQRKANGSGTANLFDAMDAVQILILAQLRLEGMEVKRLEKIAPRVRELAAGANGKNLLLISSNDVGLHDVGELETELSPERPNVVLSTSGARRLVDHSLAAESI